MPRTDQDLLRDALAELRRRGWVQDTMSMPDGRVCALGALNAAAKFGDVYYSVSSFVGQEEVRNLTRSAKKLLISTIREQYPGSRPLGLPVSASTDDCLNVEIASWNDAISRTVDQVEAIFEKAAAK